MRVVVPRVEEADVAEAAVVPSAGLATTDDTGEGVEAGGGGEEPAEEVSAFCREASRVQRAVLSS